MVHGAPDVVMRKSLVGRADICPCVGAPVAAIRAPRLYYVPMSSGRYSPCMADSMLTPRIYCTYVEKVCRVLCT